MEREICLINELEEKEFSEENLSDTSYEESEEAKKPACEIKEEQLTNQNEKPALIRQKTCEFVANAAGKDRVRTSNQLALLHLRNIYSEDIKEIIRQSEESIVELFELISGDILNIEISKYNLTTRARY